MVACCCVIVFLQCLLAGNLLIVHLSGMADGGGFAAVEESNAPRIENKRKFDDASGVVVADESGLRYNYSNNNAKAGDDDSGLPAATPAPVSYNSVAPPMSEFELAKQRAELIAARLVTGAELKRPRTEENNSDEQQQQQQNGVDRSNGSDFDQGYPGNSRLCTCLLCVEGELRCIESKLAV